MDRIRWRIFWIVLFLFFLSACGVFQSKPVNVNPIRGLPAGTDQQPWWNDSVFYEIFVRSYYDSNGDGIGDINGLISKLDYLNDGNPNTHNDLGITGIWLMPIFPSPSYHGYDVTDYYSVNPQYGSVDDLKRLVSEAHKRGIRVIIDLVLNHTSDQHPWFKASTDPKSAYRNWYVWSKENPGYVGPWGEQVWHPWDDAGYYYGVFTGNMPDLNYRTTAVTAQMDDVVRFWIKDVGVDGFRLDGAKHLIEDGENQVNTPETHQWYTNFRPFYKGLNPQAMTVGEVQDSSSTVAGYIQGDQLDLAFDFDLARTLIASAGSGKAYDVTPELAQDLSLFKPNQFATFLSNHDSNRTMSQVYESVDRAKVAAALLLTGPGVPFIYYGEEIGMTGIKPDENLRAPMQWSSAQNAGFSSHTPWESIPADYPQFNVANESVDKNSLLSLYRNLIQARNDHAALRIGDFILLNSKSKSVYAVLRHSSGETVLVLMNLGKDPVSDYALSLEKGALSGSYRLLPILGSGSAAGLKANQQGGFDQYLPLPSLPPYSCFIFQLAS